MKSRPQCRRRADSVPKFRPVSSPAGRRSRCQTKMEIGGGFSKMESAAAARWRAERIGREAVHVGQQPIVPLAAATVAICVVDSKCIASPARRFGAGRAAYSHSAHRAEWIEFLSLWPSGLVCQSGTGAGFASPARQVDRSVNVAVTAAHDLIFIGSAYRGLISIAFL